MRKLKLGILLCDWVTSVPCKYLRDNLGQELPYTKVKTLDHAVLLNTAGKFRLLQS